MLKISKVMRLLLLADRSQSRVTNMHTHADTSERSTEQSRVTFSFAISTEVDDRRQSCRSRIRRRSIVVLDDELLCEPGLGIVPRESNGSAMGLQGDSSGGDTIISKVDGAKRL